MAHNIVVSGVGVWNPDYTITNEELVASYNAYADAYNAQHQAQIEAGELDPKPHSSAEFKDDKIYYLKCSFSEMCPPRRRGLWV